MRVLITNDDGIDSPGISALVDVLAPEHTVVVVAPSGNRSGVSHAITADEAITLERRHDARVLSLFVFRNSGGLRSSGIDRAVKTTPQLVVSGINHGPNLADDVYYSGTVAGAVEASLLGIPALAVSLACDHGKPLARRHLGRAPPEIAARTLCRRHFRRLAGIGVLTEPGTFPDLPMERILGVAVDSAGP